MSLRGGPGAACSFAALQERYSKAIQRLTPRQILEVAQRLTEASVGR